MSSSRSLYSRGVRLKESPPRVTRWRAGSSTTSATWRHTGWGIAPRRLTERSRASRTSIENGLVRVVVRAGIEARDDIRRGVARRQHQHRRLIAMLAQFPGYRHAVHAGERDIQQDHVERRRPGNVKALVAIPCQHHLMAFFAQGSLQEFGHPPLVLNHQNLHFSPERNREP